MPITQSFVFFLEFLHSIFLNERITALKMS